MKKHRKQQFACILCLFFVISVFGGGLAASRSQWGFRSYASGERSAAPVEYSDELADFEANEDETTDGAEGETAETDPDQDADGTETDIDQDAAEAPASEDDSSDDDSQDSAKRAVIALAAEEDGTGGLKVIGGEQGTDYIYDSDEDYIEILTSTPLTIQNETPGAATMTNIRIKEGVKSNLTLAGVLIQVVSSLDDGNADSPLNLMGSGTGCNLTLAAGTTNTLNATKSPAAALHCGEGSTLVVGGSGTLNAYGGRSCAGIGAGSQETAGVMVFNSGLINAHGWRYETNGAAQPADDVPQGFGQLGADNKEDWTNPDQPYSAGAGIGAGHRGGSTSITINGGTIHAYGSAHGAGIGGGYKFGLFSGKDYIAPKQIGASGNSRPNVCGDITINGGFITSKGYTHGAAFGGACGSTAEGCTIRITGGTLLPTAINGMADFNAGKGEVYITGGSVNTEGGDKFINGEKKGTAFDRNGDPVFKVTINLSAEGIVNDVVSDWEMYIAGEKYEYGAPAVFDNGKLYLWVPADSVGKRISVSCKHNGKELEPLYIEEAENNGESLLKRYVDFALPEKYLKQLYKEYDGLPFDNYDFEAEGNGIEAADRSGAVKTLDKNDEVTVLTQLYSKENGTALGEEKVTGEKYVMPADAGVYKFTLISKQFANTEGFKDGYWGHRTYGWATIRKVPSSIEAVYSVKQNSDLSDQQNYGKITGIQLNATVKPGEGTKSTCEAPDGKVQFYINGIKIGTPVQLSAASAEVTIDGNVCSVKKTVNFDDGKYPTVPEASGQFIVTAEYIEGTNYLESSAKAKLISEEADEPNPPTEGDIVSKFPFTNPPIPTISEIDSDKPDEGTKINGTQLVITKSERVEPDPKDPDPGDSDTWPVHSFFKDSISEKVNGNKPKGGIDYFVDFVNSRYVFTTPEGYPLLKGEGEDRKRIMAEAEDIKVYNEEGELIDLAVDPIDFSKAGKYVISVTVTDENGNQSTIEIDYTLRKSPYVDPGQNKDTNDDKPDINVDTNGDGKPDINIDTDDDGKPDINIDTNDDDKPDINIDTNGDGKPDINIDTDGDGKPDVNIDTDGDGIPDLNIDSNDDGEPNVNVDTNNNGDPDKNIDKDYKEKYDKERAVWNYPETGDTCKTALWLSLLATSLLALGTIVLLKLRRDPVK